MTEEERQGNPGDTPSQAQQQAEGQAQPASDRGDSSQQKQAVNWQEDPDFRKFVSERDKREARMQQQFQQTEQQLQQTIQRLEERVQQAEEQGLDDYEKLQLQLKRTQQKLQAQQQREQEHQELQRLQAQKMADLQQLNEEFGIPMDQLWECETYPQALKKAREFYANSLEEQAEKKKERKERNKPFLGAGGADTPDDRYEREIRDLRKEGTSLGFARLMRQVGKTT